MRSDLIEAVMCGPLRERMLISLDTEFVDTGTGIELISMVPSPRF